MGNKVRCKFCKFEQESKCSKKKGQTTKLNKKRVCTDYQPAEEKIKDWLSRRESIEAVQLPRWAWSRKERRAERDRLVREEMMKQYGTTMEVDQEVRSSVTTTSKHPSTGDLSRFIGSTIEDE